MCLMKFWYCKITLKDWSLFLELQKEEEEQRGSEGCPTAPSRGNACSDLSHPYYDVARHGILQVTGNNMVVFFVFFLMFPHAPNIHVNSYLRVSAVLLFLFRITLHSKGQVKQAFLV